MVGIIDENTKTYVEPDVPIVNDVVLDRYRNISRRGAEYLKHARENDIDRIYNGFKTYIDVGTFLTEEEFDEYQILFSLDLKRRLDSNNLTPDEFHNIKELSRKFYSRCDFFKPIRVVNKQGEDVIPPLPPLYQRLHILDSKTEEAINIFSSVMAKADKDPRSSADTLKAIIHLNKTLSSLQDMNDVRAYGQTTNEIAENFHRKMFGKSVFGDKVVTSEQETPTSENTVDINIDDAFGD